MIIKLKIQLNFFTMDNKKNRRFYKKSVPGCDIFHNIGPELGKAGEDLLSTVAEALEFAQAEVARKFPQVKKAAEDAIHTGKTKSSELIERMNSLADAIIDSIDADNTPETDECTKVNCVCSQDSENKCACGSDCCGAYKNGAECCCKKAEAESEPTETHAFMTALKNRSQENKAYEAFINTMVSRFWAFANGENPINTQWIADDEESEPEGVSTTVYYKELHPTMAQNFEDIFSLRAICKDIADRLGVEVKNVKIDVLNESEAVVKVYF